METNMSGSQRARFLDMDTLRDRFDRVFSDLMNTGSAADERANMPIDVHEEEQTVIVKASMPGIKPDDISVEVRNGVLTIRGTSTEQRDEARGTWQVVERHVGHVARSITLPATVDESTGQAQYDDGVLTITFNKTLEKPGKMIEVQRGESGGVGQP
jgi:HSP20 family protein